MFDPNFKEYRYCPSCHRYYSQDEVENQKILTCKGSSSRHPEVKLEKRWTPEFVEQELAPLLSLNEDFFGSLAISKTDNKVVGFVWGYVISLSEISKSWSPDIVSKINEETPCTKIAYFQEIGTDTSLRGYGIGSSLCASLTSWMKYSYPSLPAYLHTHQQSPAFKLFSKAGYRHFAKSDSVNSGRIIMFAPSCSQLTPENL